MREIFFSGIFCLLASTFTAQANVIGSDLQSFNPTSDGLDFVTVHSTRMLNPGYMNLGGFLDYAVNTLPDALQTNTGAANTPKFAVKSHLLSGDLHWSLGLTKDWKIGGNISTLLNGHSDNNELKSYFETVGLTDARLDTKYRFYSGPKNALAFVLTANFPQISNNPFMGGHATPMFSGELVYEAVISRVLWAVNAGYRFRNPGSYSSATGPYEPIKNEYLFSTALAYRFSQSRWSVIGEIYGSMPTQRTTNYAVDQLTDIEGLLGLKYVAVTDLAFHTGVTAGNPQGMNTPDYRFYVGLNWIPLRIWGDGNAKSAPAPTKVAEEKPRPAKSEEFASSKAGDLSVFDQEPTEPVQRFRVFEVNFDSGSHEVPASFHPYLKRLAEFVQKGKPLKRLTIFGHTDSRGSVVMNQELSQRRAEAVKLVLSEAYGVPADKIETVGYGPRQPIDTNETSEGRARNRRVEFQIEREDY